MVVEKDYYEYLWYLLNVLDAINYLELFGINI